MRTVLPWVVPTALPRVVLATLFATMLGLQACTTVPAVVRVEEGDSVRTLGLKTGQLLEIRLLHPGRGTRIALGSAVGPTLAMVGPPAFHDDPVRDGVSGTGNYEAWLFRAVQPGSADIRMDYRLQWEATGTPSRSVTYRVTVQ
jgi:predicted secreted protein